MSNALGPVRGSVRQTLRVTSVRSRGSSGGAIFAGKTDDGQAFVVVVNHKLLPNSSAVSKGQLWLVEGDLRQRASVVDGYRLVEQQIEASDARLERPSGRNVVQWIAECKDCIGIGEVKAKRLYDRFGPELFVHIDSQNTTVLAEVVGQEAAMALCEAFEVHDIAQTLVWLDKLNVSRKIGVAVTGFYGNQAKVRVEANPYVLISFEARWQAVDEFATQTLGVADDDNRRLEAAVEEVLYRGLKLGHTCLPQSRIRDNLRDLLGSALLAQKALDAGKASSRIRMTDDSWQLAGVYMIERYVADRLLAMHRGCDDEGQGVLFAVASVDADSVEESLAIYEGMKGFTLSKEQRDAVRTSASSRVSLILGGAGTGKTTVLQALCLTLERAHPGLVIYQFALAGRAAQRMTEATGKESLTIAGALMGDEIVPGSLILIDEMSMVDALLMNRLLRRIPQGVRLVLVGDPSQLPPIGPGLVLHALAGHPEIPQVELKVPQRQTAMSGIPKVAEAIREHREPTWAMYQGVGSGVSFVSCKPMELDATVKEIYLALGGDGTHFDAEILSTLKRGNGSTEFLNAALHDRFHGGDEPVRSLDREFGLVNEVIAGRISLSVGDLVMYTKNNYTLGLRNGSLGRILRAMIPSTEESACCVAEFDGIEYELNADQVQALVHAYAITVHKSQGSQFQRVIVPITKSQLLDQALVYTAVTRGVEQVVLVGDKEAAVKAICSPAHASRRHTMLAAFLADAGATLPMEGEPERHAG